MNFYKMPLSNKRRESIFLTRLVEGFRISSFRNDNLIFPVAFFCEFSIIKLYKFSVKSHGRGRGKYGDYSCAFSV